MNFGANELKAIYGMVVGWGTEVLPKSEARPNVDPYRITVASDGGWGGTPREKSGYTMGVIQFDFGQQT